jgi:phage terminase large subunit-like protein
VSRISAGQVLAALTPEFFETLTPLERLILPSLFNVWRRPEQEIPEDNWRSFGFICGRGWGKTWAIAGYINQCVEQGTARNLGLMCTNEDRADEVQITTLIETAPPWFRPERHGGGLRWPNGTRADVFTPLAPEAARGPNFDLVWLSEIVAWQSSSRKAAFDNITTACRRGPNPRYIWDTTSKGLNNVIKHLMDQHAERPDLHRLTRGTIFDNPLLTQAYLTDECRKYSGQRANEELLGEVYTGATGALWQLDKIEEQRRQVRPERPEITLVSVDPSLTANAESDECGISVGSRGQDGHAYVEEDLSGRMPTEQWGTLVVDTCIARRAAGVLIETNHAGDLARGPIVAAAKTKTMAIRFTPRDKPMPKYTPGVIYIKEIFSRADKLTRATGPAAEADAGRVHHVGEFAELELQLCSYDGTGKSPNRYDAAVQLVNELAGLTRATPRTSTDTNVKAVQERLREALTAIGRGARIGL